MLSVTDAAVQQLNDILDQTEATEEQCIRLIQNEDQLGLSIDEPQQGDQVIENGDRPVLIVDQNLSNALEGATLDAVDTQDGKQLMLVGAESGGTDGAANDGAR